MDIELRKFEHYPGLSQESLAFSADLYIKGRKAGAVNNRGHGGATEYLPYTSEGRDLISDAEKYCAGLPPIRSDFNGSTFSMKMTLDLYIDDLVSDHLREQSIVRLREKMAKDMVQGIVFGRPDHSYRFINFRIPIESILSQPDGGDRIADFIRKEVLPKMTVEDRILNSNLPEQVFRRAGLMGDQEHSTKRRR